MEYFRQEFKLTFLQWISFLNKCVCCRTYKKIQGSNKCESCDAVIKHIVKRDINSLQK